MVGFPGSPASLNKASPVPVQGSEFMWKGLRTLKRAGCREVRATANVANKECKEVNKYKNK